MQWLVLPGPFGCAFLSITVVCVPLLYAQTNPVTVFWHLRPTEDPVVAEHTECLWVETDPKWSFLLPELEAVSVNFTLPCDFHSTYPHYVHEGEYINIASVTWRDTLDL